MQLYYTTAAGRSTPLHDLSGYASTMRTHVEIGARLRALREASGLSLEQVARKVGCVKGTVQAAETGRSGPSVENLVKIAEAVGATLDVEISPRGAARSDLRWVEGLPERDQAFLRAIAERLPHASERDRRLALGQLDQDEPAQPAARAS